MKMYSKSEAEAAISRLSLILKSSKKSLAMADVLRHAKTPDEDDTLRMAFTLAQELKKANAPLRAVHSVNYERLSGSQHEIEIVWEETMN